MGHPVIGPRCAWRGMQVAREPRPRGAIRAGPSRDVLARAEGCATPLPAATRRACEHAVGNFCRGGGWRENIRGPDEGVLEEGV